MRFVFKGLNRAVEIVDEGYEYHVCLPEIPVNIEGFGHDNSTSKLRVLFVLLLSPFFYDSTFYLCRQCICLPLANVMMRKQSASTGNDSYFLNDFIFFILTVHKKTKKE
jgi:hypothetical protein